MSAPSSGQGDTVSPGGLYRTLWRWHFYAGLFCIPFVVILALSGSLYLFRVEIESYLNRDVLHIEGMGRAQTVDAIVAAALAEKPGASLAQFEVPQSPLAAAKVLISAHGDRTFIWVRPDTLEILKRVPEEATFQARVSSLHGELLLGDAGSLVVELAASWAIVMVLSGLYLWWPRHARGLAGVLYPRLRQGRKRFWRDLHAVTGIYVSIFALFLLISGLPWAMVWGDAFQQVRALTGTAAVRQDWSQSRSAEHAQHQADAAAGVVSVDGDLALQAIVARAVGLGLVAPVVIVPPKPAMPFWQVRSDTPNRPLRATVWLSPRTGAEVARETFSDRHIIDRVIGIGIAGHEGRLFGLANQLLGLATALGLVVLCVSAFFLWRSRAPEGSLGAPPPIPDARIGWGLGALILTAGVLLPVLGMCLIAVALLERAVLSRWPAARRWLGLSPIRARQL